MLAGGIGIASPGQFSPGAIGYGQSIQQLPLAPFNRMFVVPQNGLPWQGRKTPETSLNFSFNWAAELDGDPIATSEWLLESADISNELSNIDSTDTITTILISGGIAANIYNVTNLITTESGLTLDATFRLFLDFYNW
jgi:hypothetical protein